MWAALTYSPASHQMDLIKTPMLPKVDFFSMKVEFRVCHVCFDATVDAANTSQANTSLCHEGGTERAELMFKASQRVEANGHVTMLDKIALGEQGNCTWCWKMQTSSAEESVTLPALHLTGNGGRQEEEEEREEEEEKEDINSLLLF